MCWWNMGLYQTLECVNQHYSMSHLSACKRRQSQHNYVVYHRRHSALHLFGEPLVLTAITSGTKRLPLVISDNFWDNSDF